MRRRSIILAAATPIAVAGAASAATTSPTTKCHLLGVTTPVRGITVSGFDRQAVCFAVTSDVAVQAQFSPGRTACLSLPFCSPGHGVSPIAFTGTQDAVNAALMTVKVTTGPAVTSGFTGRTTAFQKQWNDLPCSDGARANDFVSSNRTVAVPAAQSTFLDSLFTLVGFTIVVKPTKAAPSQLCPGDPRKSRFSDTLVMGEPDRYSFSFTEANGKRIPMECGSRMQNRLITQTISAPVIQSPKAHDRPVITAYIRSSSVGTTADYPLLKVILRFPDGTLERQDQPNPPLPGTPLREPAAPVAVAGTVPAPGLSLARDCPSPGTVSL